MPAMPRGAERRHPEGDVQKFRSTGLPKAKARARLFGSGAILPEVIKAQEVLSSSQYSIGADVWGVTSYWRALSRRSPAIAGTYCTGGTAKVPFVTST